MTNTDPTTGRYDHDRSACLYPAGCTGCTSDDDMAAEAAVVGVAALCDQYSLDVEHIEAAGQWTAHALDTTGHARLTLTPGDMTRYDIIIVGHGAHWQRVGADDVGQEVQAGGYRVAVGGGTVYTWTANAALHPSYVQSHWGGISEWTAAVLCAFLNATWAAIVF
jgi:hypothetical protein